MHCRQAGESLSKHNHLFSLDGLTEPSDAAAESFSKYEGDYLDIDLASSPSSAACILVVAGKDYVDSYPAPHRIRVGVQLRMLRQAYSHYLINQSYNFCQTTIAKVTKSIK